MIGPRKADNTVPAASSAYAVLVPFALASTLFCPGQETAAFLVVEYLERSRTTGLALVDAKFGRLASVDLGGQVEYAVSPKRDEIAAAWMDAEGRRFLQVFGAKDLSPLSAKTPISDYATNTTGFGHPILWMGESALVVEFVTMPRPSPDQGFDSFYAQVFQLAPKPEGPLAMSPDHPQRIELPANNTHLLAVTDGNAIVLNAALAVRSVNLRTGVAGTPIEVRPRGQDGILEAPMGWCMKDDATLLLFGFDGSVREIELRPEPKIVRKTTLPSLPPGAHVGIGEVEKDPFRPTRVLIGLEYLDKPGPVEVLATDAWKLVDSTDREAGWAFAPGADGAIVSWSPSAPASVRIRRPSSVSELQLEGNIGAIVALR